MNTLLTGIYEFGSPGSGNLIWVNEGWVVNGAYAVKSDDNGATVYFDKRSKIFARRVCDVPGKDVTDHSDYNDVLEYARERLTCTK